MANTNACWIRPPETNSNARPLLATAFFTKSSEHTRKVTKGSQHVLQHILCILCRHIPFRFISEFHALANVGYAACSCHLSESPASSPALSQRHLSEAYWSASGFSATAACHHSAGQDEISNDNLTSGCICLDVTSKNADTAYSQWSQLFYMSSWAPGQILWQQLIINKRTNMNKQEFPLHGCATTTCLHYIFITLQLLRSICQGQAILADCSHDDLSLCTHLQENPRFELCNSCAEKEKQAQMQT